MIDPARTSTPSTGLGRARVTPCCPRQRLGARCYFGPKTAARAKDAVAGKDGVFAKRAIRLLSARPEGLAGSDLFKFKRAT